MYVALSDLELLLIWNFSYALQPQLIVPQFLHVPVTSIM